MFDIFLNSLDQMMILDFSLLNVMQDINMSTELRIFFRLLFEITSIVSIINRQGSFLFLGYFHGLFSTTSLSEIAEENVLFVVSKSSFYWFSPQFQSRPT